MMIDDEKFMRIALDEAKNAFNNDEVPVGAVIVLNGEVISKAHNSKEANQNPLKHAEIVAIDEACKRRGLKVLDGATIYVTVEPCLMCAGAIYQARISRLVYGTKEEKFGAVDSKCHIYDLYKTNYEISITTGVLEDEASSLMKKFFKAKREKLK